MRKGFTLIELLVVIAIMGLLMSISTAAIFSARNKRTAKSVADQVKNVIIEAHAYAISPKKVGGPVSIVIATNSIKAQVSSVDIINPVTIPSNVTLSCYNGATVVPLPATCISFRVGQADGTDSNTIGQTITSYDIRATKNGTGEKYKIIVGKLSGNVTITTL